MATPQAPAGGEFRVNVQTAGRQAEPDAGMAPDGAFVVVWSSAVAPADFDVFGRRYSPSGAPIGSEFRVNTFTTGYQIRPEVAVARDGSFAVVWASRVQNDGFWVQRFDAGGARRGAEIRVGTTPTTPGTFPAIAMAPAGDFVVVWSGDAPSDPDGGVFARRVAADGGLLGAEIHVNPSPAGDQYEPDVAMGPAGDFVVVWTDDQDGSSTGVFGQRFDADGARRGIEFRVNVTIADSQRSATIALDPAGNFVAVWSSYRQDGDHWGVYGIRLTPSGAHIGAEFRVNEFTPGMQAAGPVHVADSGSFVVTWSGQSPQDASIGTFARRFLADATPRGSEFRANTYTTSEQGVPAIAGDGVGNFTVVWRSQGQDGSDFGVFGQRFGGLRPAGLAVDDPGNGVLDPGEPAVVVAPAWHNTSGAAQSVGGQLSGMTGPAGPVYTITDGTASYGTVANGAVGTCTDCFAVAVSNPPTRPQLHLDASALETIKPEVHGQHKRWMLHVGGSFDDVASSSPFYRFVETLLHHGVTGGCTVTEYCPTASTSRDQMAVFVLVAKEGDGYVPPACGTPVFGDVPASSPFCRWIEELARRGVVGGCGGGNYCPTASVTRDQMAIFVLRTLDPALSPPACTPPNLFADVPETSPFCRWVEELANRGIVSGCGAGNYCPTAPVTREQMGVFISVTFGLTLYGV